MGILRAIGVACIGMQLAACAITPRSEDLSGVDTIQIANRIKCEAREALRDYVVATIRKYAGKREYDLHLADSLRESRAYSEIEQRRLDPRTRAIFEKFDHGVITMDFTFDISEENNSNASATVSWPIHRGPLWGTAGGSFDRKRQSITNFRTHDGFDNLAFRMKDAHCDFRPLAERQGPAPPPPGPNAIYPITGEIGLLKQFREFFNLAYFENLAAREGSPVDTPSTSTSYKFSTRLVGGLGAAAKLEILGPASQLTGVEGKAELIRNDDHQVIVVLALPPETGAVKVQAADSSSQATATVKGRAAAAAVGNELVNRQLLLRSILSSERQDQELSQLTRCGALQFLALCN